MTGYFLWTLFYRDRRSVMSHVVARKGKTGVFLKDMGQALAMYWVLVQVIGSQTYRSAACFVVWFYMSFYGTAMWHRLHSPMLVPGLGGDAHKVPPCRSAWDGALASVVSSTLSTALPM